MQKKVKILLKDSITLVLLLTIVGCNVNFSPKASAVVTEDQLREIMPSIIDSQMDNIKDYLDDDVKQAINTGSRGPSMSGREIVEHTLTEETGYDYLNFCYQLNSAQTTQKTDYLMDAASKLIDETSYDKLCSDIEKATEELESQASLISRSLPKNQQKAFYKDLKSLVVRSTVLLTAGVVYALIPAGVLWGKVSAAAAISVGAGLVAMTIMSLYERYKFGTEGKTQTFEQWLNDMIAEPKADYALAASALAIGQTFDKGPVVAGIVVCVFAVFKATDAIRSMLLTYNFKA